MPNKSNSEGNWLWKKRWQLWWFVWVFPIPFWLFDRWRSNSAFAWPDDQGFFVWLTAPVGDHFGGLLLIAVTIFGLELALNLAAEVMRL